MFIHFELNVPFVLKCLTSMSIYLFIFNSIRIFSLAALLGLFGVLPLNYFGQDIKHVRIPSESLDIFTIGNVAVESRW
jgi:hypothetical protein